MTSPKDPTAAGASPATDGDWDQFGPEPSWFTVFVRGLARRCPRCGQGGLFRFGMDMETHCSRCQLHFERNPGMFIGGIGLNTSVTAIALLVALVLTLVFIDGPWYWMILPVVVVSTVLPLVFFASSKMLWVGFELKVMPPEPGE